MSKAETYVAMSATKNMPQKEWFLYLIECADGSLYTGISTDVAKRYAAHVAGKGARYTKAHKPIKLIGSRLCGTRSDALKAEFALKKLTKNKKIDALHAPINRTVEYLHHHPKNSQS